MRDHSLSHLSDLALEHQLTEVITRDNASTASVLVHIAEFDRRGLYRDKGYPSMHAYCVKVLHLAEYAAFKRIRVARLGRRFPQVFAAVAEGRAHLTALVLLAGYVTKSNIEDLLASATYRTKAQVEQLIAERFPRPDVPTRLTPVAAVPATGQLAPGPVEAPSIPEGASAATEHLQFEAPSARVTPLAPQRFALQVTICGSTEDKLRYAQELLSHTVKAGDVAEVLDRALDALIAQLEKQRFAATKCPKSSNRMSSNPRHIPADVKRAVWARDDGRCTYVADDGTRCPARTGIEYDHVDPVALGGTASVGTIRLRCHAHNQLEAERTFGREFMAYKREEARRARGASPA